MAKEIAIALNFSSKGERKVIQNLQQLEAELKSLQGELKTLDFGSPAFKEATTNINRLKSQIKDIDKSTEGLETAQRIQAIGNAVGIAVSSFQVLTGVIGLFITDQEDLEAVQRAEVAALQVLNVAIGVNTILYQNAELAAKGLTIQTQLLAAVNKVYGNIIKTATAIQVAFNAALAANPIAIVTLSILALTAAVFGLIKVFKGSNEEQERAKLIAEVLNTQEKELIKTRKESARELEFQLKVLTDNISTRALELKIINDLKKTFPGFNTFIGENNKLTEEGLIFLRETIKLKQAEAGLNAVTAARVQEEIRSAQELLRIRQEEGFTQRAANLIRQEKEKSRVTQEALNQLETRFTAELNAQLEVLTPLNKKLDEAAEKEKNLGDTTSETTLRIQKQNVLLQERILIFQQIADRLAKLQSAELTFTTDVLEKQNEVIQLQNELLQNRRKELGLTNDVVDEIATLFFDTIPNADQIEKTSSAVFELFNTIRTSFVDGTLDFSEALGFDDFKKRVKELKPDAVELIKTLENIPEATQESFVEFFNSYRGRLLEIKKITEQSGGGFNDFFKTNKEFLNLLLVIEKQQSDLFKERIKNGLTENEILEEGRKVIIEQLGLQKKLEAILDEQSKLKEQLKTADVKDKAAIEAKITLLGQQNESLNKIVDTILEGVVRNNKFVESIKEAEAAFKSSGEQIEKNKKLLDETFDVNLLREYFANYGDGIEEVLKAVVLDTDAFLTKFGEDGTKAILDGVLSAIKTQGKLTKKEVLSIIDTIQKASVGIDIVLGRTSGGFSDLIEQFKKGLRGLPKELTPLQTALEKIKPIVEGIANAFLDLSGRLQTLLQANTSLLLEQLQQDEVRALDAIGDASERANELRLEQQKEFARKRFEIEKRARLQELNFAIANSLASSAGAIINALLLPPPFGVLYASTIAALTGAQVAVIRNQKTSVQSQQFVGRRGGLIQGQSHEGSNGGVPVLLEGGEFIVNREAVNRFGDQISDLNSATGGRRLTIDDSRLVQAISSQNMTSTPLKAFVLYNDIQNVEKLNKKITQLARL